MNQPLAELPVVVIGAGPVGLAAAAHLAERDIDFLVAGCWGHRRRGSALVGPRNRCRVRRPGRRRRPAPGGRAQHQHGRGGGLRAGFRPGLRGLDDCPARAPCRPLTNTGGAGEAQSALVSA